MKVKTGITGSTPDRIIIDAGAVYLNYGLAGERLLGATRGGNEFNLNRATKNIEADGLKGAVKGMKRVTEVNPQITANLLELSVENLVAAIAGAEQTDLGYVELEHQPSTAVAEFYLAQNDVIGNSEKVYLKQPDLATAPTLILQKKSKKYASRFVGANAANNKGFDSTIGNWVKDAIYPEPVIVTGGYPGKCLKFTGVVGADEKTFLTLSGANGNVLTNLVPGEYYRLQIAVKMDVWAEVTGVDVTVACDDGEIAITPTTSWVVYVTTFLAANTSATITLTAGGTGPVATDILYIDSLELERLDYPTTDERAAGQVGYTMKLDGGDKGPGDVAAKASVIFMKSLHAANDEIVLNYTYAKSSPDHTTITGGEIGDTDYIDNVAIVGNVSGKTKPVICIVKNALADAGFSLATAPRDEAVPAIIFTGHYDPGDLDAEPWEIRWPNA